MYSEIHAWIFVKSDSINFPERNHQILNGKPLIAYTIEAALKSRYIRKVFISTDSPDIAAIAEQYGAIVPFLRPKELCNNTVPVQKAWKHAVEWNRTQEEFPRMDIMVSLPITVPLRTAKDIDTGLELYHNGGSDMVVAVTPSNRNPAYDMVFKNDVNEISLVLHNDKPFSRKRSSVVYDITNMFFICNSDFAISEENFFNGKCKAILVPRERSFDIRTKIDLKLAEYTISEGL